MVRPFPLMAAAGAMLLAASASAWTLVGWNNLGMHCMDADYSVFSLLPPYNTIHAQLIDSQGRLVRSAAGLTVTYEAIGDGDGSINRTSHGKTNFWSHVEALFGVTLPEDVGLTGLSMPGDANVPQPMTFDAAAGWFVAEGVPITPYDDAGHKNSYPLMRLVARDSAGTVLATTDIVLPVSDEMDCSSCHASGSSDAAQPLAGWVNDPDPQRDMRLNILRLHDDRELFRPSFQAALQSAGYDAGGLYATATADQAILCARCHLSEALPGSGIEGIPPLTQSVHGRMANVIDPLTNLPLSDTHNRSACYRCHPGAVTRCLRGAMGNAVAADGSRAVQCQSCHGDMLAVASSERTGWLNEPACQSCHTGTAMQNSGTLRYTSAFDDSGNVRQASNSTYATNSDTPAAGLSLYRFSKGHGDLACAACHGSTHAELPSSQRNDNVQSMQRQGHVGTLVECTACHFAAPLTVDGGPHGMHPVGQVWVDRHPDEAESGGTSGCRDCHGADLRGTVLSRVQGDRTLRTDFGTKHFWRGFQVGCYACHNGPASEHANPNHAAQATDASLQTKRALPVTTALQATDADGNALTLRIVTQPQHGTVALSGVMARYLPEADFNGEDTFTFAAWDGSVDSNLATVTVNVEGVACAGDCDASGEVTVDELVQLVNVALGTTPLAACAVGDLRGDGAITVDEIIYAINVALSGC